MLQFGQWTDAYAGTTYGIGVASEDVLAKFQTGFESGILARPTPSPKQRAGSVTSGGGPSPASAGGGDSGGASAASSDVLVSAALQALHCTLGSDHFCCPHPVPFPRSLRSATASLMRLLPRPQAQLKYENERLKIALGTSATNAKRWEQELQVR